jgi:histidinol-phosphate aminotransferase
MSMAPAFSRIQALAQNRERLASAGSSDDLLLDFNERTRGPSMNARRALRRFLADNRLHVYPQYANLPEELAGYTGASPDQIMITNGASQGIDLVFRAFTNAGDRVIIPSPSFVMLYRYAQIAGTEIILPSYGRADGSFPHDPLLEALDSKVKLIVICNPNNPTGTSVAPEYIARVAQAAPHAVVLVDEAYFEFCGVTAVPLIQAHPNIVVVRTFSKAFGLAALRIGYVVAAPQHIVVMRKACCPYDVNMAACVAAAAALGDAEDLARYVKEVMVKAKPMVERFLTEQHIPFYPSSANFVLFKPKGSEDLAVKLRQNGIVVCQLSSPGHEGMIRVTIGSVKQMRRFIDVME